MRARAPRETSPDDDRRVGEQEEPAAEAEASVAGMPEQAREMMLWGVACTALGVEAMRGTSGSFDEFIHRIRPHPGQRESARLVMHVLKDSRLATHSHEEEGSITDDAGVLRQDRYPLRTAAQFLGPQIEDILSAHETVTLECNSSKRIVFVSFDAC